MFLALLFMGVMVPAAAEEVVGTILFKSYGIINQQNYLTAHEKQRTSGRYTGHCGCAGEGKG